VIEVRRTTAFAKWFANLRDARAKARIQIRIDRVELGNLGDAKFFEGIGELRIDYAQGDKSTQRRDIRQAIELARELD
jgi:putative addiction module killer protein